MKSKSIAVLLATIAMIFAADCATQTAAGTSTGPEVDLEQVGSVLQLAVAPSGGVPMEYRLTVQNPFEHDLKLLSVEIGSVGDAGGYSMKQVRHKFDATIPPQSTHEIRFRAWIRVLTESEMRSVDHPVLLRGIARFEGPSGLITRNFSARVNSTKATSRP